MASGLGHGIASSVTFNCKSTEASATVSKGQVVMLLPSTAITFAEGLTADPVFAVQLNDTVDGVVGEGGIAFGVAAQNIPPGEVGPVIVFGLAKVLLDAAEAVGDVLSVTAAGIMEDAAGASHESPCAILLETVSADDATDGVARWAFVDFIASAMHGVPTAGDSWHGVTY